MHAYRTSSMRDHLLARYRNAFAAIVLAQLRNQGFKDGMQVGGPAERAANYSSAAQQSSRCQGLMSGKSARLPRVVRCYGVQHACKYCLCPDLAGSCGNRYGHAECDSSASSDSY